MNITAMSRRVVKGIFGIRFHPVIVIDGEKYEHEDLRPSAKSAREQAQADIYFASKTVDFMITISNKGYRRA